MDIYTLHNNLVDEKVDNFYIFTGLEVYAIDIYIKQIAKIKNMPVVHVDDIETAIKSVTRKSFIETLKIFVITDDKTCQDVNKLKNIIPLFNKHILILTYSNLDKRGKLYKEYKDNLVVFDRLPEYTILDTVKHITKLSDNDILDLLDSCDGYMSRFILELDKVQRYSEVKNISEGAALTILLDSKVIYTEPKDDVFELVDAILKRQVKRTYKLLNSCKEYGVSNLQILQLLFTNARQLLQLQSYNGKDVMKSTGLTYPQVKAAQSRKNIYTTRELVNMLKLIQTIEKGIKVGTIDSEFSIDYLIVSIF